MSEGWQNFASVALLMTAWFITSSIASRAFTQRFHLKENSPTGTIVAELADILDTKITPKKNFQLLSEKLMTYGTKSTDKRRWMALDETTGTITLQRELNREAICGDLSSCLFQLQIFVRTDFRMVNLEVEVLDVNEHAPAFPVKYAIANVSEEAQIGDVISLDRYLARDRDAGNNSIIVYVLSPTNYFSLVQSSDETGSPHLQLKVERSLDYERKPLFDLTLNAEDKGEPRLSSQVPLQVRVIDANDNSPRFDSEEYPVVLRENLEPGYVITRVQARDPDSGASGTVRYFLATRNPESVHRIVAVNEVTGEVTLKSELDRESNDKTIIYIEARDLGERVQKLGRTRLVLHVGDVNDNAPVISISYIAPSDRNIVFVSETSPNPTYFAYVSAKDADFDINGLVDIEIKNVVTVVPTESTPETTLASQHADALDTFVLNKNGFLGISKMLDREVTERYTITLQACDQGKDQQCSYEQLDVVVMDENDHAPQFSQSEVNVTIAENASVGSVITTITATDGDNVNLPALKLNEDDETISSTNGDLSYSLTGGDGSFAIEPRSGSISLVRSIDREQYSQWTITVTATDGGGQKAMCTLNVFVTDVNDNTPQFTNPVNDDLTIYATIVRDDIITRMQAVDYDLGINGEMKFSLVTVDGIQQTGHVNTSLFVLNSTNGDLRLNMSSPLLRSSLGPHSIVIQVRDGGKPTRKSERRMTVIITDKLTLPTMPTVSDKASLFKSDSSFLIIIVALSSALVLLIIVSAAIACKCRKENKKVRTYSCSKAHEDRRSSVKLIDENATTLPRTTSKESLKGSIAWSQTSNKRQHSQTYDSTTDVTNLSRSDAVMSHQFTSSGASLNNPSNSRQVDSTCVIKSRPLASSSQLEGDSGHGDSDPDVTSGDISFEQGFSRQRKPSELSSVDGMYIHNESLGPHCNKQCLELGHSDTCWMPTTTEDNPSNFLEIRTPASTELSEKSGNLEPIPETQPVRSFWAHVSSQSTMSSIYSSVSPTLYATPNHDTYADPRHVMLETRFSVRNANARNNSTTDSITTGYVTEPEII
uniref:Protocadherin 18-like n=1 Tax=Phallusia mammillata TaxID=59560 RepID=A0A6F9DML6_9ASCI|nr:protocadherin 18-like [Phallusia mammillata]